MRLVVAVEDHLAIVFEDRREGLPERLEARVVGYDGVVVAAVVMGVDDGVGAFGSYVVYVGDEGCLVSGVGSAGHGAGDDAFHEDGDAWDVLALDISGKEEYCTEDIEAFSNESIDG